MILKNEIIGIIILFIGVYIVIYLDHKFSNSKHVSLKIPIFITLITSLAYLFVKPYLSIDIRQEIIIDPVDF